MGFYFWRTTHNPLLPPYLVDVRTYMPEPQFFWQKIRAAKLVYNNLPMQQVYEGSHVEHYWDAHVHPIITAVSKLIIYWLFFFGPLVTAPAILLFGTLLTVNSPRDVGCRPHFFFALMLVSLIGMLLPVPYFSHYAAPTTCLAYALMLQAMRRVKLSRRSGSHRRQSFIRFTIASCVLVFLVEACLLAFGVSRSRFLGYDPVRTNPNRVQLTNELKRAGGQYLIFVHYRPEHDPHDEWVYNDADIDKSRIVWAREMDLASDQRLVEYFKKRQVFTLDADAKPPQLQARAR
jgi:hypothetical protein